MRIKETKTIISAQFYFLAHIAFLFLRALCVNPFNLHFKTLKLNVESRSHFHAKTAKEKRKGRNRVLFF
jgi:hypothetical protein